MAGSLQRLIASPSNKASAYGSSGLFRNGFYRSVYTATRPNLNITADTKIICRGCNGKQTPNVRGTSSASSTRLESTVIPPPMKRNTNIKIQIPEKISREPTDILKALASTIGTDYTAPNYRYHDDPYLIPMSNLSKRSFILSKESGRKAAKWVKQKHSELFMHQNAEPPVEAFFPSLVITEETPVDESTLVTLITQGRLSDAMNVYETIKTKGNAITPEIKQAFLEFLCYYNEIEPLDEDLIEERWFTSGAQSRDRQRNTWKINGLAERLFKEIKPTDSAAYCSVIRGRAKYYQAEKAYELLKEAQSKGVIIDADTYNSVIRVACFCRESSELRWQLIEELLTEMENSGVQPNLGTMNAILESLSTIGNTRQAKTTALEVMSEFRKLGIEPCLASYYYILITFCKERGPVSTILIDIMKEIEGKEFIIQDVKDTFFFVSAMDICRNHLQDLDLAIKVDTLLHTGNNYDLIGDSYKESIYYRHYMSLKANMEPFDKFMEFYNKLVPNIYTPEPGIMEDVLKALELNQSTEYLSQLWSDVVIFDQTYRENIIALFLHIMASVFPSEDTPEALKLREEFVQIAWKIWTILETQEVGASKRTYWSGKMLGDLLAVTVKADDFEKACDVLQKLSRPKQDVIGVPEILPLKLFLEKAIERENGAMGLACVQYVSDSGYSEVGELADDLSAKIKLDALQMSRLSNMVGFDRAEDATRVQQNPIQTESEAGSDIFTSSSGIPFGDR